MVAILGAIAFVKKYLDMKWYQVLFLLFKSPKEFITAIKIRHRPKSKIVEMVMNNTADKYTRDMITSTIDKTIMNLKEHISL